MEMETMNTMNEEIVEEVTELTEVYDEVPAEISEGGNFVGKVVKGLLVLGAGAVIALGIKNKKKINDWRNERAIKKLEKQGFTVEYPDEFFEEEEDFEVDCDEDSSGNIIEIKGEEE